MKIKVCLTVLILFLHSYIMDALTVELASLEELTVESNLIISGKVGTSFSQWENKNIYTYTDISISNTLKGKSNQGTIRIKQLGGTVGEITQEVEGTPALSGNDEVVLFLVKWKNHYWIHSIVLGYYNIIETGSVKYAVNNFNGVELIDPNTKRPVEKDIKSQYELSDLFSRVKKIVEDK